VAKSDYAVIVKVESSGKAATYQACWRSHLHKIKLGETVVACFLKYIIIYQLVIDPSGRKYVCARLVSYFVTSRIGVSLFMSSSTPSPGLSLG